MLKVGFVGSGATGKASLEAARIKGFDAEWWLPHHRYDLVYITHDIPTDSDGNSDHELLGDMLYNVGKEVVTVTTSQVPAGFCRKQNNPNLFYQVETLITGRELERSLFPEARIIGCLNPINHIPANLKRFLLAFNCPVLEMSYESAELAKSAINMFLTSSVVLATQLYKLASRVDADWSDMVEAFKTDERIKKNYMKPGLGIGPHLKRDLVTVLKLSKENKLDQWWIDWLEAIRRESY